MPDNPSPFLLAARQIPRNIGDGQHRNIKRVAKSNETGGFVRRIDVQTAGQHLRLVGDNANTSAIQSGKTYHHIAGKILMGLEKFPVVNNGTNDVFDIIRLVGVVRYGRI